MDWQSCKRKKIADILARNLFSCVSRTLLLYQSHHREEYFDRKHCLALLYIAKSQYCLPFTALYQISKPSWNSNKINLKGLPIVTWIFIL